MGNILMLRTSSLQLATTGAKSSVSDGFGLYIVTLDASDLARTGYVRTIVKSPRGSQSFSFVFKTKLTVTNSNGNSWYHNVTSGDWYQT